MASRIVCNLQTAVNVIGTAQDQNLDPTQDNRLSALLALGQLGDRDAYQAFLLEASACLRRYLMSRIRLRADLEDVLQETLFAIHRARHTYTPGRPVAPWMYAICENRAIDAIRKRQRMEKLKDSWRLESVGTYAEANFDGHQQTERVLGLLDKLPRRQKQIIELLKLRELPVAQIAALTGMSESAVKVTAFRGYERVRQLLGLKKK